MADLFILFTRFPIPGRSKTRLIPALGPAGAAAWQREMTARTLDAARTAIQNTGAKLWVIHDGGETDRMKKWLGPDLVYLAQSGGDLGQRMSTAFETAFGQGYERVILFGSDIPGLDAELLAHARDQLLEKDMVMGPARDGGFYLIGLKEPRPELFRDIDWSTDRVLAQTLDKAKGLLVGRTRPLTDVDRPRDLPAWRSRYRCEPDSISVIIPALNEEANLGDALEALEDSGAHEVILVDGGSTDRTREIAKAHGAEVILHPPGRAGQQNRGAARARGGILLFLHADTILPAGFARDIRQTLALANTSAGAFSLALDGPWTGLRVVERLAAIRCRLFQMPYGDQALFLKTGTFWRAGGFPDQPLMEDFELVSRLKKQGRVRTLKTPALTSARRWQNRGLLKTTLLNQLIILGYSMNIPPKTLARLYNRTKGV